MDTNSVCCYQNKRKTECECEMNVKLISEFLNQKKW